MIRTKNITSNKVATAFIKMANTNIVAKTTATLIVWGIAFCPIYLYFFVSWWVSPSTFWQTFAIVITFLFVIGWLQVILAIIAFIITLAIIFG